MLFRKLGKLTAITMIASLLLVTSVSAAPVQIVSHVKWFEEKAFVQGNQHGELGLDRPITLAETITLLARLGGETLDSTTGNTYWAAGALQWGLANGIITEADASEPNTIISVTKVKEMATKAGYTLPLDEGSSVTRGAFIEALGAAITTHITIGHTNDVHGHIIEDPTARDKEFGYAKMATLIKEWRQENPNFLLLDAGDTFQGTLYVNESKGESIVPILNRLNYEAMAAGNHEFDFGWEQTLRLRDMLDFPMLSANVFKEDGSLLLAPVHFAEIGGKSFAFLGFVAEETPIVTHPDNVKGLTFKNPVEIAKEMVPELKKQVDHVVVVSHVGIDVDRQIAAAVDGIDLIVGGHSHTPLSTPEVVNGVYIVQDWEYGKSLGRVDLWYYNDELVLFSGGLIAYDEKVIADAEIAEMVKEIEVEIEKVFNVVIGKTEITLDGERANVRLKETNLGNLTADIMLARTQTMTGFEADVAITNGGGIRGSIEVGDITKKGLHSVFPFPNTLVVVEVTGEDIVAALENGVTYAHDKEKQAGQFPQIAGMSFKYDSTKPAGERILEVLINGKPIDHQKVYRVATNDFLAAGGDGYEVFKKSKGLNTGITFYNMMEEALATMEKIEAVVEGRIIDVAEVAAE